MYQYGLLATLVLAHVLYAESRDDEVTAENSTKRKSLTDLEFWDRHTTRTQSFNNDNRSNRKSFIDLEFWDRRARPKTTSPTQSFNQSLRKSPPAGKSLGLDLEKYVIEAFLNNIVTNKTVFRYSEVKQYNTEYVRDRAMKNLSGLMDLVLKANPSKTSTIVMTNDVTPVFTNARRTKFEQLFVWSRDPVFEVTTTLPRNLFRRKIPNSEKYHKHQHHADTRRRANAARRMAMALTYNRRINKIKKRHHKHGKHSEDMLSRKSNNAIASPDFLNGTNSSMLRSKSEKEKKDNKTDNKEEHIITLSPYSIYRQLNDILIPKLDEMGVDGNATLEVLGRTLEYNDIVMIKATTCNDKAFRAHEKFDEGAPERKIVVIVHGLSVMGYNSLPCLKTINGLATLMSYYYKHIDKFDIYVIPMANPDGVAAATAKPYWNKNMSPQGSCPGVALDRNFDVYWPQEPCTMSSCNQQFPGLEPFSELETQVLRDVFHKYSHRIIAYIHVHSSSYSADVFKGDGVLYPKGHVDTTMDDDRYIDIKAEIDEMMKNASFKVYSVAMETLFSWYGKVLGTSVDFANKVYGVPYAMEFAMQLYNDDEMLDDSNEAETSTVLQEVWKKVIDVIFEYMYKTLNMETK